MNRAAAWSLLLISLVPATAMADKRPMTVDDLFKFKRVSDPQISPDGKLVVYVVGTVDLEKNAIVSNLWLAATDGKTPPRQLTDPARTTAIRAGAPTASASSSSRTAPATNQLWVIDLGGGEARQLTTISTEASNAHLVARRQARSPSSRPSIPSSPTSRSRRATRPNKKKQGGDREEPGQGEGLHPALLPPLGLLRRGQAAAPVRDGFDPALRSGLRRAGEPRRT